MSRRFWTTWFELYRKKFVFWNVMQFVWKRDWLGENKNDLSPAFSTETFGFLVETKAMAYHSACYTILHNRFYRFIFYDYMNFLIVFIVWMPSRGQQRGKTTCTVAGNNNNFTWYIRGFTLRRDFRCRWFGRRFRDGKYTVSLRRDEAGICADRRSMVPPHHIQNKSARQIK